MRNLHIAGRGEVRLRRRRRRRRRRLERKTMTSSTTGLLFLLAALLVGPTARAANDSGAFEIGTVSRRCSALETSLRSGCHSDRRYPSDRSSGTPAIGSGFISNETEKKLTVDDGATRVSLVFLEDSPSNSTWLEFWLRHTQLRFLVARRPDFRPQFEGRRSLIANHRLPKLILKRHSGIKEEESLERFSRTGFLFDDREMLRAKGDLRLCSAP